MARQLQAGSNFIGAVLLSDEAQSELFRLSSRFGQSSYVGNAGHVLRTCAATLDEFQRAVTTDLPLLPEIERLEMAFCHLEARSNAVARPIPSSRQLTLWDCLEVITERMLDFRMKVEIGALCYLELRSSGAVPQVVLHALYQAACELDGPRYEATVAAFRVRVGPLHDKAARQLIPRSTRRASAASDMLELGIEQGWRNALAFTDSDSTTGRVPPLGLNSEQVRAACSVIRKEAEAGNAWCILFACCVWLGLNVLQTLGISLLAPLKTGLLRLSGDCAFVEVNLSGVLSSLARTVSSAVKPTSDILALPLPEWLANLIQALREQDPTALTLGELLSLQARSAPRKIPGLPHDLAQSATIAKLIRSRAQPLCDAPSRHHVVILYATLDFRRVEKSTPPYHSVAVTEIVAISAARCEAYAWGRLCALKTATEAGAIGSRHTPTTRATIQLFTARREALKAARCGPNADWPLLRAHFNQLVLYTMLAAAVGWLFRGSSAYGTPASALRNYGYTGRSDKLVGNGEGVSAEYHAGRELARQFDYLSASVDAILDRISSGKRAGRTVPPHALAHIQALRNGDESTPLFAIFDENDRIRVCGHQDLTNQLDVEWTYRPDSLRHAGADAARAHAKQGADVELILRHLTDQCRLRSDATALTTDEWRAEARTIQDALLRELGFEPCAGMVSRIQARRTRDA